jgi:hypothetical protein
MAFSTPIGFLIFNRPDVTEQVFAAIAKIKPEQLFVIADGPRSPDDYEKCQKTRTIIEKVDWDCDLKTNFSDVNLGCGWREASGFDWVFSHVEEAIFLEDDTLPSQSFFHYCQALLERYRDDERIMHINGDNSLGQVRNQHSYFFSKYVHGWGWASWRRAWKHYDYSMKTWPDFKASGLLEQICDNPYELKFWTTVFDQMHADPKVIDTWDYQWAYACFSQHGLAIEPNYNFISNIGFQHPDAVHTIYDSPRAKLATAEISEISHPPFVVRDREADAYTFDEIFDGKKLRAMDTHLGRLRQSLAPFKNIDAQFGKLRQSLAPFKKKFFFHKPTEAGKSL